MPRSLSEGSFISSNRALSAAPMPVFARTYREFVRAIDWHRADQGLRHLEYDALAGVSCGMSSKLASGVRTYTPLTLDLALQVLGLEIALVDDGRFNRRFHRAAISVSPTPGVTFSRRT